MNKIVASRTSAIIQLFPIKLLPVALKYLLLDRYMRLSNIYYDRCLRLSKATVKQKNAPPFLAER